MDEKNTDNNLLNLVKNGYNEIANIYNSTTDKNITKLEIFKDFISLLGKEKRILDLGCGSGLKVGEYFFKNDFKYTGIDFSEEQINLAKKNFPYQKNCFQRAEMVQYCKQLSNDSFDGVIALFSIFHLPINKQVQLFIEIKRILTDKSPMLITVSTSDDEGIEENWLGGTSPMYWSNKLPSWYEEKLSEIGFEKVEGYTRTVFFDNKDEIQNFLLYKT